jgi:PAS domain-containing protein
VRNNSKRGSSANRASPRKIRGEKRFPVESKGPYGKSLDGTFASLMESLSVGVAVATRNGGLLYTNSRFLETLGQPPRKNPSGSNLKSFVAAASWRSLEEAMSQGALETTEGEIIVPSSDYGLRTIRFVFLLFWMRQRP